MSDLLLFWHRRDLRLGDNLGLARACQRDRRVVGVFCLDPNILQREDVAPARVAFMLGCLQELQERYAEAGSALLVLHAPPDRAIPQLAQTLDVQAVYWNHDVEPYAQERDRTVAEALQEQGIEAIATWDQLLHTPDDIRTNAGDVYKVYTPFWRNWKGKPKAEPIAKPPKGSLQGLTEAEQGAIAPLVTNLPTAKDLGFVWENPLPVSPGEQEALGLLGKFCQSAIAEYDEQRNFPANPGTSRLSAALKFGAIGIRTVWQATQQAWERCRSDEARTGIQTWQQELAWREFYQHVMYHFPELATGPYRQPWQHFPWSEDAERFQAWCEGRTGYPIVDAAMRELNETGWMHNRCRMIVASFLTKDLIINWQWGEKYFMQKLVDGDLSANNGGWQWSASSGMDPKPLRIFNPASQAAKFDPEAAYIRDWLPEVRSLDTASLISGEIPPLQREACNYPAAIVEHKKQQQKFKDLYKKLKM